MRRCGVAARRLASALLLAAPLFVVSSAQALANVPDFASQVAREESVVVTVTTMSARARQPGNRDDDLLHEDDRAPAMLPGSSLEPRPGHNLASGFIISREGHILSSAHAVDPVDALTVRLFDGREFVGRVLGLDDVSDVALLKIEADGLPVASIGEPRDLLVGDWVVAIGAPFGFESSVTAGIVSAKRFFPGRTGMPFIQSDVAINPGSSGGPLFNLRGEVVGMNSMAYTHNGGYMGVSFSLPANVAMDVAGQLRTRGRVVRSQLGLHVQETTLPLARVFRLTHAAGALITRVDPGSQGERAGLRSGDIVVGFGDGPELSYAEMQQIVAMTPAGTSLLLNVWRTGAMLHMSIEVTEAPRPAAPSSPSPQTDAQDGDRLGLVFPDAEDRRRFFSNSSELTVRETCGPARRAGIASGDVIVGINDHLTRNFMDYQAALARLPKGAYVAVLVRRDGQQAYISLGAADGDR
jgi:serine protease Do